VALQLGVLVALQLGVLVALQIGVLVALLKIESQSWARSSPSALPECH